MTSRRCRTPVGIVLQLMPAQNAARPRLKDGRQQPMPAAVIA
jgi:hypothetical protein